MLANAPAISPRDVAMLFVKRALSVPKRDRSEALEHALKALRDAVEDDPAFLSALDSFSDSFPSH